MRTVPRWNEGDDEYPPDVIQEVADWKEPPKQLLAMVDALLTAYGLEVVVEETVHDTVIFSIERIGRVMPQEKQVNVNQGGV